MKRYTYAVFIPGCKWARTNNKRQAIRFARQHQGYVTQMPYSSGKGPWDAPTFRGCSDLIADFGTPDGPQVLTPAAYLYADYGAEG